MEKQFELTLTNSYKNMLVLVGTLVFMWLLVQGSNWVDEYASHFFTNTRTIVTVYLVLVFAGGFVGMLLLARRLGGIPTLVTVGADELLVLDRKSGKKNRVAYATIASYDTSFFNRIEALRLTLSDGNQLKLTIDTGFQDLQTDAFWGMVRAFEAALIAYQARQQPGVAPISLKEPDFVFFASILATIVLVIVAAGWGLALWQVARNHQGIGGGFFLISFGFLVYGALWYDSRSLRRR